MNGALDLTRTRDIGQLLDTTWKLFVRHFLVFYVITLLIYGPYGILTGVLTSGIEDETDPSWGELGTLLGVALLGGLTLPALVTAAHVVLVQGLGRGEEPSIRKAFAGALPRFPTVIVVGILYSLAMLAGFIALLIPGIYLAVRLYFGTQAAVVDQVGPTAALGRSWEVVRNRWWATFGSILLAGLLVGVPIGVVDSILSEALDSQPLYLTISTLLYAAAVSYGAIFGTLLFFSLRARRQWSWEGPAFEDPSAPERPVMPEHPQAGL